VVAALTIWMIWNKQEKGNENYEFKSDIFWNFGVSGCC